LNYYFLAAGIGAAGNFGVLTMFSDRLWTAAVS